MEPKELLERSLESSAVSAGSPVQDIASAQTPNEAEDEPAVVELAGQVKEALAPVKAPPSVRDKLRIELVEVAQHRQCQDLRVESPSRRREWAIGAIVGSLAALAGGVLYLLRSRMQGPSHADSQPQAVDNK
jgi:hypothetical protein